MQEEIQIWVNGNESSENWKAIEQNQSIKPKSGLR